MMVESNTRKNSTLTSGIGLASVLIERVTLQVSLWVTLRLNGYKAFLWSYSHCTATNIKGINRRCKLTCSVWMDPTHEELAGKTYTSLCGYLFSNKPGRMSVGFGELLVDVLIRIAKLRKLTKPAYLIASSSGEFPYLSRVWTDAPCFSKYFTVSRWPSLAATCNVVRPS